MERMKDAIRDFLEKDRYEIFTILLLLVFVVLGGRLFYLTGIRGSYFREISENRRAKDIIVTAPRGEIHDRKGLLIAGNRPVFTVQLRKDEIDPLPREEKNKAFLQLVRYLEEDGVSTTDDFPIDCNVFRYKDQNRYIYGEQSPTDQIVERISEHQLLPEILNTYYEDIDRQDHYEFYTANRFLHSLDTTGEKIPIIVKKGEYGVVFSYIGGDEPIHWKKTHDLPEDIPPKEAILQLAGDNPTHIRKLLEHPIARKLCYDVLLKKGLVNDIAMEPFFNSFYKSYFETKLKWMSEFPSISLDSTAESDFYTIFSNRSMEHLLRKKVNETDEDILFPGKLLVEAMKEEGEKKEIKVGLKKGRPYYKFEDGSDAFSYLLQYGKDEKVMKRWLTPKEMKVAAQSVLIEDGIITGISIADDTFRYVDLANKEDWEKSEHVEEGSTDTEAFLQVKERYKIPNNLGVYETRGILNIYYELNKQGNLAYIPINYAYKIKNETVAKISENINPNTGITVSSEPIRHYPLGETCSHILGYIGKISTDTEVNEYINRKEYERNALIGKTGIEQNYEDYLHGTNGNRRVEVDSVGNTTKILEQTPPQPGNNVYLSIDLDLQKKAEETLKNVLSLIRSGDVYKSKWGDYPLASSRDKGRPFIHAQSGAIMAVDVHTGKILAMASFPGYDPNLFATGISSTDWESLLPKEEKNPLAPRPLYNIPLQTAVQPGSIFKMITGLTALEKGMKPNQVIKDGGYVEVGGSVFGCWLWNQEKETHGDEDLYTAIRDSCNYYFYSLALGKDQRQDLDLPVQITADDISEMAQKFGLGSPTGIEIKTPAEAKGNLPNPKTKTETMKQLLRNYLNSHLREFYIGKEELTNKKSSQIIEKIVSLMDEENVPERQKVFEVLEQLELDTEKVVPGRGVLLGDFMLYDYFNQAHWNMADTMNVTIGQGANSYTLAQITRYVMALANGGTLYPLSFLEDIKDENNNNIILQREVKGEQIQLNDLDNLEAVKKGMHMASLSGANKAAYENFPISVGIKTGTAQRAGVNPYTGDTFDSFSWQIGFAPYENPEIAVACVLVQGGPGSNGSPLIREVIAEYFGLNKEIRRDSLPIETVVKP
ncbi:MAG: penicillin-binding transpeptidase domain-containing protein [Tissierellia bacterium]|nr:penicillin-binding transpeptidase domain-containing protein [Tissierellia bacterium]